MTFTTIIDQAINFSIYASLLYIAVSFFFWTATHDLPEDKVQEMIWQDTCLQWQQHKEYWQQGTGNYYDLLASFVPKTDTYTMTSSGILEIGNGGLKRTFK